MKINSINTSQESNYVSIGGRKTILPKQVLMLVADVNYTTVHLFNGERFIIATTIKKVQKKLDSHGNFVRTNRKFVVNWDYVQSHSAKHLTLQNNQIIPFSRRKGLSFQKNIL